MNDEELKRALEALPPQDPEIDGWAKRARRTSQTRRGVATAAVLVVGLGAPGAYLANVWQTGHGPLVPGVTVTDTPIPSLEQEAPVELTGVVAIHSIDGTDQAKLCAISIVAEDDASPECDGPTLKGDFSWDDVKYHEADGSRWTDEVYRVYGYYDLVDGDPISGEPGSFTLSRPVEVEDPSQQEVTARTSLCDAPTLEAPGSGTAVPQSTAPREITDLAQRWPGYIDAWIDEAPESLNVLVEADTDIAGLQNSLSEVWNGPICLGQAVSAETQEEVRRYFRNSSKPHGTAYVGTRVPDDSVISVVFWAYDEGDVEWVTKRAMDEMHSRKIYEPVDLKLEFVLNPVGASADPILVESP